MNTWALTFFVISMLTGILGFTTDIDPAIASIAKLGCAISFALMLLSMLIGMFTRRHKADYGNYEE